MNENDKDMKSQDIKDAEIKISYEPWDEEFTIAPFVKDDKGQRFIGYFQDGQWQFAEKPHLLLCMPSSWIRQLYERLDKHYNPPSVGLLYRFYCWIKNWMFP